MVYATLLEEKQAESLDLAIRKTRGQEKNIMLRMVFVHVGAAKAATKRIRRISGMIRNTVAR